jgi:hypothetical protein
MSAAGLGRVKTLGREEFVERRSFYTPRVMKSHAASLVVTAEVTSHTGLNRCRPETFLFYAVSNCLGR